VAGYFLYKEYQKLSWSKKADSGMYVIAFRGGNSSDEVKYLELSNELFELFSPSGGKSGESDLQDEAWGNFTWHRLQFFKNHNTDLISVKKKCDEIEEIKKAQSAFANLEIIVIDDKGNKY